MHASEAGAALALQPENEGEKTALSRLRDIYRRATQYRLPAPYWDEEPGRYCDLDPTGEDALVVRDGMGTDTADGEAAEGVRTVLDEAHAIYPENRGTQYLDITVDNGTEIDYEASCLLTGVML